MTHRDYALALLDLLEDSLTRDRPLPDEVRTYLLDVCRRVRADDPDPLGIKRPAGRQPDAVTQREIAKMVHDELSAGYTLAEATFRVGEIVGKAGGAGEAVEKAYRTHRAEVEAMERIRARCATDADWETLRHVFDLNATKNRRK